MKEYFAFPVCGVCRIVVMLTFLSLRSKFFGVRHCCALIPIVCALSAQRMLEMLFLEQKKKVSKRVSVFWRPVTLLKEMVF
ncbi:transmembrane protein, putative [Bodo saltans]|uniref:Transmembrane protein, putative n=1 Tax=Bodo saltans TaxID=75058 RepID=A0A0S4IU39_BODSA|nr:transmembrane protein, putative [Bodo saltans]|eukprot:CUF21266.1 transmembrane protein, putative [Bodo saltans]